MVTVANLWRMFVTVELIVKKWAQEYLSPFFVFMELAKDWLGS